MFSRRTKKAPRASSTRYISCPFDGGLVTLHVPAEWQESAGSKQSTIVLCDPKSGGATFCISVHRLPDGNAKSPREALGKTNHSQSGRIEDLENGKALLTHSLFSDGGATETRMWHLALNLIPSGILVVLFSYTFTADLKDAGETQRHLTLLDEQIRGRPVSIDITDYIKNHEAGKG
jgi:hypothetical protein